MAAAALPRCIVSVKVRRQPRCCWLTGAMRQRCRYRLDAARNSLQSLLTNMPGGSSSSSSSNFGVVCTAWTPVTATWLSGAATADNYSDISTAWASAASSASPGDDGDDSSSVAAAAAMGAVLGAVPHEDQPAVRLLCWLGMYQTEN